MSVANERPCAKHLTCLADGTCRNPSPSLAGASVSERPGSLRWLDFHDSPAGKDRQSTGMRFGDAKGSSEPMLQGKRSHVFGKCFGLRTDPCNRLQRGRPCHLQSAVLTRESQYLRRESRADFRVLKKSACFGVDLTLGGGKSILSALTG